MKQTILCILALAFTCALAAPATYDRMASVLSGELPNGSGVFPPFMDTNPVAAEEFSLGAMGLSQTFYDEQIDRALDFWESWGLTCTQYATPQNATDAFWGMCDKAVIYHIHVPFDINGDSLYFIDSLQWDGTDYNICQLTDTRKLDMLFMAVTYLEYTHNGVVVPSGQSFPVGVYKTDCIKNGCNSPINSVDPIIELYHQSAEGIGSNPNNRGGAFLCDVCSPTLDDCATTGQVQGIVPFVQEGSTSATKYIQTSSRTFYPKPSVTNQIQRP